jgi:ribosomal protein S18 acetylase RimI-like enzyme
VPVAPAVPAASAAPAAPAASAAPSFRFETFGKPPAEAQKCISQGLIQHAIGALGPELGNFYYPLCITIRDDQNRLVGGLIGKFTWNFLHIDSLWVSGEHRGHNLGSRLMRMAEESARAEGIRCITVETTSFEAIGFYPKLGYEVIAEIKDVPPGHSFYYLKKML